MEENRYPSRSWAVWEVVTGSCGKEVCFWEGDHRGHQRGAEGNGLRTLSVMSDARQAWSQEGLRTRALVTLGRCYNGARAELQELALNA